MKKEILLCNPDRTVGFIHVPEFEGMQTTIDLKYLKQAIKNLDDFAEKGLTPPELTIGIEKSENNSGMCIFFLDIEKKNGIAIAAIEPKEDD